MPIWTFLAGVVLAGGVTAMVARVWLRRQADRVARAERRAADAERLAELGTMTGGLAHEIKNPLSTIALNSQLLTEDIQEARFDDEHRPRIERRIDTLQREVQRLRGILTDFLQFAGRIRLDPEPHDVNALVGELVDFFAPQAENAGVRLRQTPVSEPVVATVDAALFKQALLNLLLNATQALESGGDANGERELLLRVDQVDGDVPEVCVHVTDTGPGMDEETLKQVFLPYFSTKAGGTGLGLPTTRRIIEEHGGRLEVHSEPGRGSDFVIRLPVHADGPSPDGR